MRRVMTIVTVGAVLFSAAAFAQQAAQPQAPPPAAETQKPVAAAVPAPPPAKPFPEGSRIAFIDVQRVASESAEGKAAAARITDLSQKRSNELAAKNKAQETANQKLSSGGALMSEDARAQLQKEIDKLQLEIERTRQDAQGEIDELNRQLQNDFQRKLSPVIQQVSSERGLYILFSRGDAGIVWADTALDLTAEIVRRFDAAMAAAKTPAAPKPPKSPRP